MIQNTGRWNRRRLLWARILLCQGILLCGCRTRQEYHVLTVSTEMENQGQLSREIDDRETGIGERETANPVSASESETRLIRVYVCGAVVRSGVYELADGARVADALEMAGGFSPDADREWVNLARTIVDGERLAFYTLEQTEELKEQGILCEEAQSSLTARNMSGSQPQSGDEPIASSGSSLVNLNTATKEELMSLPGIGETRAEAVLRYRQQQGPFQSIEEIMQIRGIKESVFASIRDLITV